MEKLLSFNELQQIKNKEIHSLRSNYSYANSSMVASRDYSIVHFSLTNHDRQINKSKKRTLKRLGYKYIGKVQVDSVRISKEEFSNYIKNGITDFLLEKPIYGHVFEKEEMVSKFL